MRRSLLALVTLLVACQDNKVGVYSTPPAVSIVSPASGSVVAAGDLVELTGVAEDQQTKAPALDVRWESSLDGEINTDHPDGDGNIYAATSALSPGDHTITLTVTDEDAESGTASITLSVGGDTGADTDTHPVGSAPTIVLLGPADGETFGVSDALNLVAAVTDAEDAYDTIACEVVDSRDGSVWTGSPTSTGSLTVPLSLSVGTHELTLNARDSDGNVSIASVGIEVLDDGRPTVTIGAPSDGDSFDTDELISFRGTVSDDVTDTELLGVTWSSDISGVIATNPADSAGHVSTATTLPAGIHTITLTAVDGDAKSGSDSIVITVVDPLDRDDDGDGWTENAGDCDDRDASVNPDVTDVCDGVDNDCSGGINDSWFDGYEVNNTEGTAYDFGEVDATLGWDNSTLSVSGLTFSDATDEDWFHWDADDEWYDNISISVAVTGLPSSGNYVLELLDDSGTVRASDSGPSGLSVSYDGDEFDTGEDHWYLRIYPLSWPSGSCGSSYSLRIHS